MTVVAAGLSALNGAEGGNMAIGGSIDEPVDATPEPASIVLLVTGLAGIGAVRLRKRSA